MPPACSYCRAHGGALMRCGRCTRQYCSRGCQRGDWKRGHKQECASLVQLLDCIKADARWTREKAARFAEYLKASAYEKLVRQSVLPGGTLILEIDEESGTVAPAVPAPALDGVLDCELDSYSAGICRERTMCILRYRFFDALLVDRASATAAHEALGAWHVECYEVLADSDQGGTPVYYHTMPGETGYSGGRAVLEYAADMKAQYTERGELLRILWP